MAIEAHTVCGRKHLRKLELTAETKRHLCCNATLAHTHSLQPSLNTRVAEWLDPTLVDIHTNTSTAPRRALFDPRTGFICINQSILAHVLAQNPSIPAYQYWHTTQAKHPSGCLTCFWARHHHPSVLDFYKPNDLIWINKSCFQTLSGVDMQSCTPTPAVTSIQGPQKTIITKTNPYRKVAFWYWCTMQHATVNKQEMKFSRTCNSVYWSCICTD